MRATLPARVSSLLAVLAIALGVSGCASNPEYRTSAARCSDNICLAYLVAPVDSDGDGVSDADEIAAGTNPRDPKNHPPALAIAKLMRAGELDSFNRGLSEIIVLPTKGPDGKDLVSSSVRALKPGTLEAMGISVKALAGFGITIDDGFNLSHALPLTGEKPGAGVNQASSPPPMKIGGINIALYSGDQNGADMGTGFCMGCNNPASEAAKPPKPEPPPPPPPKPDGGTGADTGTRTDPDAVAVVPLTPEEFQRVWFKVKGGTVSRTAGRDVPSPVDQNSPIIGRDPKGPIILVDPDQSDRPFGSRNKLIVIQSPPLNDKRDQNTNFGPTILSGARPGSAVPKP